VWSDLLQARWLYTMLRISAGRLKKSRGFLSGCGVASIAMSGKGRWVIGNLNENAGGVELMSSEVQDMVEWKFGCGTVQRSGRISKRSFKN